RDIFDNGGYIEDQVVGVALLPELAVDIGTHSQGVRIVDLALDQPGPDRAEGVEALGLDRGPIHIGHEIAGGHVVDNRVAADVSHGLGAVHAPALAANHYPQFRFVVHVLDTRRGHDRGAVADQG